MVELWEASSTIVECGSDTIRWRRKNAGGRRCCVIIHYDTQVVYRMCVRLLAYAGGCSNKEPRPIRISIDFYFENGADCLSFDRSCAYAVHTTPVYALQKVAPNANLQVPVL